VPPVPLVEVPMHRVVVEGSPEFHRHAVPPRRAAHRCRRVRAARAVLVDLAIAHASLWCSPHTKMSPLARSCATQLPSAAACRRRPPLTVGRAHACIHSRWIQIATLTNRHHQPSDLDPTGQIEPAGSIPVKPEAPRIFAENPLYF
jgi:hypothetical protein